jgi:hypothetical protein
VWGGERKRAYDAGVCFCPHQAVRLNQKSIPGLENDNQTAFQKKKLVGGRRKKGHERLSGCITKDFESVCFGGQGKNSMGHCIVTTHEVGVTHDKSADLFILFCFEGSGMGCNSLDFIVSLVEGISFSSSSFPPTHPTSRIIRIYFIVIPTLHTPDITGATPKLNRPPQIVLVVVVV